MKRHQRPAAWRITTCVDLAVSLDGGLGVLAVAACVELPPGAQRDAEIARWARRLADGPRALAVVIDPVMTDDEVQVVAALAFALRAELVGRTS